MFLCFCAFWCFFLFFSAKKFWFFFFGAGMSKTGNSRSGVNNDTSHSTKSRALKSSQVVVSEVLARAEVKSLRGPRSTVRTGGALGVESGEGTATTMA